MVHWATTKTARSLPSLNCAPRPRSACWTSVRKLENTGARPKRIPVARAIATENNNTRASTDSAPALPKYMGRKASKERRPAQAKTMPPAAPMSDKDKLSVNS
jgi:hypothetical protein